MKIRAVRLADLARLVSIYNQAVSEQTTADTAPWEPAERRGWLARHEDGRHPILVAEAGGRVVGWIRLGEYREGRGALRHTAEVSYYVDPGHRRQGVGTALLEAALAHCSRAGIRSLIAILLEDNRASVALLERFGFERWGHLPRVADFDGREVGQWIYGRRV